MKPTKKWAIVQLDEQGRVAIPKEFLERLGWKLGRALHLELSDDVFKAISLHEKIPACSVCYPAFEYEGRSYMLKGFLFPAPAEDEGARP